MVNYTSLHRCSYEIVNIYYKTCFFVLNFFHIYRTYLVLGYVRDRIDCSICEPVYRGLR